MTIFYGPRCDSDGVDGAVLSCGKQDVIPLESKKNKV
jgi:hypothetical protein